MEFFPLKSTGVNIKLKVMLLILPRAAFSVNFTMTMNVHTVLLKGRQNSKISKNFRSLMNNQGSTTVA